MTTLVCSKCNTPKDESEFHKDATKSTGFRPDCKACRHDEAAEDYQENKAEWKAKASDWQKKNKDKVAKIQKRYADANRETRREVSRTWQKNNLAHDAARSAQQRTVEKQATPAWANKEYIQLFYDIAKLEEARTGRPVHVDHFYPLNSPVVCGLHVEDNLQHLFAKANIAKKNRLP